jgi:hypothetical protein
MTLGPSEAAQATCLQLPGAPAFGDCDAPGTASLSQE